MSGPDKQATEELASAWSTSEGLFFTLFLLHSAWTLLEKKCSEERLALSELTVISDIHSGTHGQSHLWRLLCMLLKMIRLFRNSSFTISLLNPSYSTFPFFFPQFLSCSIFLFLSIPISLSPFPINPLSLPLLELKLLYDPVCPSVRQFVGRSVCHNFLQGRKV